MNAGRRRTAVAAVTGVVVAAVLGELVRPRSGRTEMLDWSEIEALGLRKLKGSDLDATALDRVEAQYAALASRLEGPLLHYLGGLPPGTQLPHFQALDRPAWLRLNLAVLRRALEPLQSSLSLQRSHLNDLGQYGINRYTAGILAFLAKRVLGQFDPQLLGREPVQPALYLVETNIAAFERKEDLPGEELRSWIILHELTHAWQFAANPWLARHLNAELESVLMMAADRQVGWQRLRALTVGLPRQWEAIRRLQAIMTLAEGHGNLVMNELGRRLLPSFERLEKAHAKRSRERSALEQLFWRITGLELKLRQYEVGEAFCRQVVERHGVAALNQAWQRPETMPRPDEFKDPERWYRRVVGGRALPAGQAARPVSP
ncbi:MAG: zinc-dependent metalloprotease [Candidatus Dormibacteraeota bacterium]|uniref:Zinc-dependent metalloprotease n=1 Tax=Candidatus Dormiibacter inghamiae TaxID=3127013 RepID=A0A934K6F2_9BACT|nr:zinc-dependent metalloprotease [Candidatus Dormibacteraeota bacterium]MBJ7605995.1 zinc-dependent metalloprotease [Candidatus Dormibacteraeota bacterium]